MQGNPRGGAGQGARGGTVIFASPPPLALPQAAILQQTAEYIFSLEQEKTRLLQQNTQLKRFIQVLPRALRGDGPGGWGRDSSRCLGSVLGRGEGGERMEAPTPHAARVPRAPSFVGEPWDVLGTATGVALPSPGPGGGLGGEGSTRAEPPSPDTASPWRQEFSGSSPKRRRAEDKDEGIGSPDIWEDEKAEDLRREMIELRQQLDKERSVRMMLEEQVRLRDGAGGVRGGLAL